MRIAVWHNLPSGGGKRALYYHVKGLVERGHFIESWCPPTADPAFLPLGRLVTEHIVPLKCYPKRSNNPLARLLVLYRMTVGKMGALQQHCRQCADEINSGGFDLLFANSATDYAVAPIARYVKIPKVIYLQEPYRPLYEASPVLPWALPTMPNGWWHSPSEIRNLVFDLLAVQWLRVQAREEYLSANAFDSILVNSLYSRESVLRAYGLDGKVCPLGIDSGVFINRHLPRENFAIGVGAIAPSKNVRFIIEALAQVPPPRPPLVWVANTCKAGYLKEIESFASIAGVDFNPRIEIGDEELIDLLNRAALMVYAPRLEPFGFAPLEANACGLPIVAVAEGGVRETIVHGKNGLLVQNDPSAMADAIQHLMHNPQLAREMGEKGCKLVADQWSLERAVQQLEMHLKETVEKRNTFSARPVPDRAEYWKVWTD